METSIRESDFVLLICTPTYSRKANHGEGGVGYEKSIVTGEIFQDVRSPEKFVPIIKEGSTKEALPSYLKGTYFADFRDEKYFDENFQALIKHIHGAAEYARPRTEFTSSTTEKQEVLTPNKQENNKINQTENLIRLSKFAIQRCPEGLGYYSEKAEAFAKEYYSYSGEQIENFIRLCTFAMKKNPEGLGYYSEKAEVFAKEYYSYSGEQIENFIRLCTFAIKRRQKD
jgi:hypothetical protein